MKATTTLITWLLSTAIVGGGAAAAAGKLAASGTEARIESVEHSLESQLQAHTADGTIHPEAARRIGRLELQIQSIAKDAEATRRDALYTRTMVETLFRQDGRKLPPEPVEPKP